MKRRMFPTFICLYKAIDRIFYRFTSIKPIHDVGRTRENCVNHESEASDCDCSVTTPVIRKRVLSIASIKKTSHKTQCVEIFYGFTGAVKDRN